MALLFSSDVSLSVHSFMLTVSRFHDVTLRYKITITDTLAGISQHQHPLAMRQQFVQTASAQLF